MKYLKIGKLLFFSCCLLLGSCQNKTTIVQTSQGPAEILTEELLTIMGESYLFGYPLILMDLTKRVSTNIEFPDAERSFAPINQLGHARSFPDHTLTAVVKPNVDTYYSIAWLDLAAEPLVLSVPAMEQYYLLPLLDAYSNVFASPGTRTTGKDAQTFLIAGPNWEGTSPEGMQLLQSPTEMAWLLGRIQVNDPADGKTRVKDFQDSLALVPLSAFGNPDYRPTAGIVKAENKGLIPVKAIQELDVYTYFNRMAELMVKNPPKVEDSAMVRKMASIGLEPGKPFDLVVDNLILKTKLKALPGFIHDKMEDRRLKPDESMLSNGWMMVREGIGTYGTDYLRRAYIDFIGLGACIPEDAMYPNCALDKQGDPLDASQNYLLHFEADEIPPVHAFWSLTAYNSDEFLVKNDLNRFALGDRDKLNYNEDGSLDIYVQSEAPTEEKRQNWLPIPQDGPFYLTMRLYWPKDEVLSGAWNMPFVMPAK